MLNSLTDNVASALHLPSHSNIVLTIGNTLRSDDGVGPYIASQLKSNKKVMIVDAGSHPENVIDRMIEARPKYILIIDAADFNGRAGEARLIDKERIPEASLSTHAISLKIIAAVLHQETKAAIKFLGVQPETVKFGQKLSGRVKKTADLIIEKMKPFMG